MESFKKLRMDPFVTKWGKDSASEKKALLDAELLKAEYYDSGVFSRDKFKAKWDKELGKRDKSNLETRVMNHLHKNSEQHSWRYLDLEDMMKELGNSFASILSVEQ
jgi:hypothetical protein